MLMHIPFNGKDLLHQMLHEGLQTNIICEDCLGILWHSTPSGILVCGTWVELAQQETCLRSTSVAHDETRKRESIANKFLLGQVSPNFPKACDGRGSYPSILLRRFKQLPEVLVALLVLVPNLAPLRNGLSVEYQNMEERI